ncbi:MAG TPA: 23S rRNA (pseudouridine(1915)-N(3))-methyltransferase RlmH [Gammaproteobacteria bacterium]|nr:23S rRNA (pseudouridine(1915)-N(3))-methyltransferase RlmH [Gammaproteobacteria bacterium]
MQIHIIAIGERMPDWVTEAYQEYAKRLPHECRLTLREIPAGKRGKGADLARLTREEGVRQLAAVPAGSRIVALDRSGREMDTVELAERLGRQLQVGNDLALLIGGPEGLAPECLDSAYERWSLSRLTFAHPVARVVLAEQLYRAWSILRNLPYHR